MSTLDRFDLHGKVAIVTGGNRGIGFGIADSLAGAGADVVIANRDVEAGEAAAEEIADEHDVRAEPVEVDVTSEPAVEAMVAETVNTFGSIDVLVNNAGITINTPAEEMTLEEWQRVIDINLTGVFLCSKHVGAEMIDGDGGSIVNVSSNAAFGATHPQPQVGYNASKAGLEGFKFQLASEWAEHDIRVNNINPGYIKTEMVKKVLENDPEMAAVWQERMLLDDMGTPETIGSLATYLASDASWYMTGESITIDGGYYVR